jgi:hypothetical protein
MLHNPYLQTPAKILESGIIDEMFMHVDNKEIIHRIIQCENGVYTIDISDKLEMIYCAAEEFEPIDDGYIFNIQALSQSQWISVIFGEIQVFHFVHAISGAEEYLKEAPKDIYGNQKVTTVNLYHTGADVLNINESMHIDKEKVIAVSHDITNDLLFVRYRHHHTISEITTYYKKHPYKSKGYIISDKIKDLKKELRRITNNAEAISRNESRLKSNDLF